MSDQIVKTNPFRESFASTVGTGVGIVLVAGIPALFIGGMVFYVGWKAWRRITEWKRARVSKVSKIDVREVVAEDHGTHGVILTRELTSGNVPQPKRRRRQAARQRIVT